MAKVTLNDLSKALGLNEKEPKKDFHYYGTIVSSNPEDRTYEVSINRDQNISVEAARLVGAAVGDTVMVTVMANGYATVTGRLGGDLDATDAQRAADDAADVASNAMGTASSALSNAQQANQAAAAARTLAEHAEEEAGRAHTAAEQAASDASSAAASASSAATSASNAESSASSAATSASNAESSASRASTAATNAESSASRASTAAQNAEADASSAATSASNAESSASSAATSASNAETDASRAATSASNAESSASRASTAATNAESDAASAADDAATAKSQASAATTAANEAKTQAGEAKTAADEAKTDANTAKRDAAAANAAANGAVASLAITQGVVDQLGQDMDDMQTHVAMMDAVGDIPAGLHVVPSSGGYFMVIANDGVYVYDDESVLVAKYGHDISFDSNREHKIGNNTNYIRYYDSNNDGIADSIEVVANNIRLGSYSVADKIAEAKQAGTDASNALNTYKTSNDARVKAVEDGLSSTDEDLANYITSQADVIEDLQNQIDGAIDTWYYSGDPTLGNQPAVAWTTDETKENHLRDLYFNTQNGHSFRFAKEGNTYKWIQIQDADATKALADAAAAQGTANVKKRVFVAQPTPPYDIGDLWVQGSTGDIKRCATAKTSSQSFAAADWVLASKYTDDTKANAVESDLHTNYYVKSDFSVAPDKIASTISATETTVKTYADDKASTAESNAKTYADNNFDGKGSAASALSDAKDYADDNFDSKGSASAAQAAAISAAAADATSKANAAESNAKADTTNKLKSYYTKTQTDSAITQKADNILSTVSTTYQTKADMDDYSTTAEMNSAIDQKADSITSTVSQTYATKTQAQGYANTAESNAKTAAATDATNKANAAKADAISTASTDATNKANAAKQAAINDAASKYYNKTETYTKSEIEQKAGEISLSVAQEEVEKVISVKEASGNIVHVEDASEYPALSLKVNITPIQDLHGYDHPWVGGGGKNLFNISGWIDTFAEGQQVSFENDTMTVGTTAGNLYAKPFIFSETNTTITLSFASADIGETIAPRFELLNESGSAVGSLTLSAGGGTITRDAVAVRMNWSSNYGFSVTKPQIEFGSTATSYEPYENICPISGWDSVDVYKRGVNVWDEEWELGDLNSITGEEISSTTYIRSVNYTPCVPNAEYYGKANSKIWLYWYDKDKNFISNTSGGFQNTTKTAPSTAHFFRLVQYASTYDNGTSINYPSTDHDYHAYNGQTITKALGQTVYGCEVDIVSGVLTVDRVMVTLDGSSDESINVTPLSGFTQVGWGGYIPIGKPLGNFVSDTFAFTKSGNAYITGLGQIWGSSSAPRCFMGLPAEVTDVVSARQWLSEHPTTIVYELATPQTYQLTPTEVKMLLGENNVWADAGDVYLKYATMNSDMNALMNKSNADLKITAEGISSEVSKKVGNDEIISKINQSAESVKIQASKVEIDGTATFNAIKSKADAAYDAKGAADAKKSIHTLDSNYSRTYAQFMAWCEEGYDAGGWAVSSTAGVAVGDTVRIKCSVSDMNNAAVYVLGTVTAVTSATILRMTSHGLDTTIIDGGNILTNSITANQIKGNTITLGQIATDVQNEIDDAAKTATDYLTFTEADGLTVGKTGKKERVNIKSSGMNVYDSSDASVAEFGSTARIGKSNSSRFVTNASSLEAYNASNQKYFEVSASGITFGTNAVAKTSDIPTKTSDLTNDSSFATTSQLPTKTSDLTNDSSFATTSQLPTKTSQLTNDSSYQNATQVTTKADAAAKTATNYLTFDETNGLDIGYTGKIEHTNIKADGMRIYDKDETNPGIPAASFLSNGSTIGKAVDGESRTVTSNKGMRFYKRKGSNDITLAHIGYDQGVDADGHANTYAPYYTFGKRKDGSAIGNYSIAEGFNTTASGYGSHAEGDSTTASGSYSTAEGFGTTASAYVSHAEGEYTTASGYGSHAEGISTTASNTMSHAEGVSTTADGQYSHAEGAFTTASGIYSHAEGEDTTASGAASHAQNLDTEAGHTAQTAIGKYNDNKTDTAFEIGNGSSNDARSNALTVDWNGNVMAQGFAGMIQMFAGSTAPAGWLMCNGAAVSRTDYAELFAIIGTTYGAGDGSTTFNLPDMRGRFPLGSNSSYALNAKAGSADAVVVSHTHPTASNGYLYMLTHGAISGGDMGSQSGSGRHYPYQGNRSDGAYWGSQANTGAASSGVSGTGKNMPPYIGINFIIATGKTS